MIKRNCIYCNKEFISFPSRIRIGKGKYCSRKCRTNASKGKKHTMEHKLKISKAIKGVKNPFWGKKHTNLTRKIISLARQGKNNSPSTEFKEGFIPWNKGKKGLYFQSEETRRKISRALFGKNAPNWKGGITSKNRQLRHSVDFKLWRELIFLRDEYTCQKCYKLGVYLHPHHILNFSEYPNLRYAQSNGITFCAKCHKEFHDKFGRMHNNEQQILIFLDRGKT